MRKYTVLVHEAEEGGYWAEVEDLPGCFASGDTLDELEADVQGAIEAYITASRLMGSEFIPPADGLDMVGIPNRQLRQRRSTQAAVVELEGIDPTNAEALERIGLRTTDDLLENAGSAVGRARLAASTGLSERQILEWVNRADLMRINGVGSEFSDLLEAAGVDTVRELATRVPANLQDKLKQVNEAKRLTRRTPNLAEVERWVAEAKTLKVMVSH